MKALFIALIPLLILSGCSKLDNTPTVDTPTSKTEGSVTTEGPQGGSTIEVTDTGAAQNVGSVFETSTEGLTQSNDPRPSTIR